MIDKKTSKVKEPEPIQYGWICPICGVVNAPWKDRCDCISNIPQENKINYTCEATYDCNLEEGDKK